MSKLLHTLKHLPGKHDQKSHGRRSSSAASGAGVRANDNKNVSESLRLKDEYGAQPKQCWYNSATLIAAIPGAEYVEGYFAVEMRPDFKFPIEHGWLEKDGEVLDVTLAEDKGNYYAARRYTYDDMERLITGRKEIMLPITPDRDSAMMEARRLSHKEAFGIDI